MQRYHFNLFNDVDCWDEEGVDCLDLPAAKEAAIDAGRRMIAEHVTAGRPVHLHHRIEVADDQGKVLAVVPFREIVTIID